MRETLPSPEEKQEAPRDREGAEALILAIDALHKVEAGLYTLEEDRQTDTVAIRDEDGKTVFFGPRSQLDFFREVKEKREDAALKAAEWKRLQGKEEIDH